MEFFPDSVASSVIASVAVAGTPKEVVDRAGGERRQPASSVGISRAGAGWICVVVGAGVSDLRNLAERVPALAWAPALIVLRMGFQPAAGRIQPTPCVRTSVPKDIASMAPVWPVAALTEA